MAIVHWRGDAQPRAQVLHAVPAAVESGDLFRLRIGPRVMEITAAEPSVAHVTAALAAAWNNSTAPETAEVEAVDEETHVRLTAREPGRPFLVTAEAENGGAADTQSLTLEEIVPSGGPHHWDDPANWSGGAVPAEGDVVYLADSETDLRHGLAQGEVVLAELHVAASYTGRIGLPRWNVGSGAGGYAEYRPRRLAIGAGLLEVGRGPGSGSPRLQIDSGSAAAAVVVHGTGLAEDELPAFLWRGGHAENTLHVLAGTVGVAAEGGEEAELAELRQSGGAVRCGPGLAVAWVELGAGELQLEGSVGTLRQSGGVLRFLGAGMETLVLEGGLLEYRGGGTIGSAELDGPEALLDFSHDLRGRTIAACTLLRGTVRDPHGTVTWTAGLQPGRHLTAGGA